jgi:hypothetical protein
MQATLNSTEEIKVTDMKNEIASFLRSMGRKQVIAIVVCLSAIVGASVLAMNMLQSQLPTDGDHIAQQRTETASLLCEWRLSKDKGFFTVNVTNQHDFRVSGIMVRGQFKNGSLLIIEFAPPHDTLEPSQSHTVRQEGNANDIDNIKAWGYYLVGTDNTD